VRPKPPPDRVRLLPQRRWWDSLLAPHANRFRRQPITPILRRRRQPPAGTRPATGSRAAPATVEEQHSKPALLFVVRSDSLRGAFRDARIRSEGGSWSRKGIRLRHPAAELCTGQIDGHVLDQPARSLVPGWILMHCRSGYARAHMRRVAQPHAAAEAKPGGDRGYPAPHRWRSRQSVRRMRTSPIRRPSSPPPGSTS
jgi:hypothetical protein